MVLTEIWLRKYNEAAIIMCYKVKVFDNIDWKFGSPISPMPLPEEGGKENVLVKMEGNTHTLNLTFLMKNETINGGIANTGHGGLYNGYVDDSKTIFEKIKWFSNEDGFIGTHLGDKYDIVILSSPPSGANPMTSSTNSNSPEIPEFSSVVDNTVLTMEGFVRNISLRTSAGEPATLRCSIEFIEGNLIGGYQNRVPQPVRSFQMLVGDWTGSNEGINPTTKMTYVFQIPRSVGSSSLIGYTIAYREASAVSVSATGSPPDPATGWVYATPSPAASTVVLLSPLDSDTEYAFKVKARNAKGGGEWSRVITKSTAAP